MTSDPNIPADLRLRELSLDEFRRIEGEKSPLYNRDLAPVPVAERTWTTYNFAALWISMAHCIPTYMLASGLIGAGMSWWQALCTILLGNTIVLLPILPTATPARRTAFRSPCCCAPASAPSGRTCRRSCARWSPAAGLASTPGSAARCCRPSFRLLQRLADAARRLADRWLSADAVAELLPVLAAQHVRHLSRHGACAARRKLRGAVRAGDGRCALVLGGQSGPWASGRSLARVEPPRLSGAAFWAFFPVALTGMIGFGRRCL